MNYHAHAHTTWGMHKHSERLATTLVRDWHAHFCRHYHPVSTCPRWITLSDIRVIQSSLPARVQIVEDALREDEEHGQ